MNVQIGLPLDHKGPPDTGYIVTPCNAKADEKLQYWQSWPFRTALLVGPRYSGRSSMAHIFAQQSGGMVCDDASDRSDEELFHIWNRAQSDAVPLLLVLDKSFHLDDVALPDLHSRLAASQLIMLDRPDEHMIKALIEKLLGQRGHMPTSNLINYVGTRCERSYESIKRFVDIADALSLEQGKAVGRKIASQALSQMNAPVKQL